MVEKGDDRDFLGDPTAMMRAFMLSGDGPRALTNGWETIFEFGRMAMALEVLTRMKTVESTAEMGLKSRVEAQVELDGLEQLLLDLGLWDRAVKVYHKLCEWRRPKFETMEEAVQAIAEDDGDADASDGVILGLSGSADASGLSGPAELHPPIVLPGAESRTVLADLQAKAAEASRGAQSAGEDA